MSLFALILNNLIRHKLRSALTIVGIGVGITTIVTLGIVTAGLKEATERVMRAGGADFSIAEEGVADLYFSAIDENTIKAIARTRGVEQAVGVLLGITPTSENPYLITMGIRAEDLELTDVTVVEGQPLRRRARDEVLLGKTAAATLKKGVGDRVRLYQKPYDVVGIYETGNPWQDGGAFLPLEEVQRHENKRDKVTMILVKVQKGVDIKQVTQQIEEEHPDLVTMSSIQDYSAVDQGLAIVDAAVLIISLIALGIGGIGVMNTMLVSVFERTREIGTLRALGWRRHRVLSLVLGESLILCLAATAAGTLLGIALMQLLFLSPIMRSFLEAQYPLSVFLQALAVGLAVGLLGGFYPAWRATRLSPMAALRYE